MNPKHTPTPWKLENSSTVIVPDGAGGTIAEVYGDDVKEQKANAAFIVKAVNAHDVLVTALRRTEKHVPRESFDRDILWEALKLAGNNP